MLVIGDEVLDGRIVDTNSQRLAWALHPVGLLCAQRTVITDDIDAIVREAQAIAARGTKLCVVSGGLGPTSDDLTGEAFARLCNVPLVRDATQEKAIEAYLLRRGRQMTDNQRKQADRPQGAEVIANATGTAPGFAISYGGCRFVSVPGVPTEFDQLVAEAVVAPLAAKATPRVRHGLYCYGIIEAEADRRLAPIHSQFPHVRLQFRIKFPEVHVTMHTTNDHNDELRAAVQFAREALGDVVFAEDDISFAAAVLGLLAEHQETVAVAESCTGGLVCDMLTDVPGSSANVNVGLTAYANSAKRSLLGVSDEVLHKHGAVSEAAVIEMANGARNLCNSGYGIAISGIAGPTGSTAHKPVGLIWFGLSTPERTVAKEVVLPHDRRRNKIVGAYLGLDMLRRHLLDKRGRASKA